MTTFTWVPLNISITTVIRRINYKNYFTHSEPQALYTNLTSVSIPEDRLKWQTDYWITNWNWCVTLF